MWFQASQDKAGTFPAASSWEHSCQSTRGVEDIPAHCRGWTEWHLKVPLWLKPFHDSVTPESQAPRKAKEEGSKVSSISTCEQRDSSRAVPYRLKNLYSHQKFLLTPQNYFITVAKATASTQSLCTQLWQLGEAPTPGKQSSLLFSFII